MPPSNSDQSFAAYQHKLIMELKEEIANLTKQLDNHSSKSQSIGTRASTEYWDLPYVFEITRDNEDEVEADMPISLYVRDDKNKGLRVPGRSGYIKNDGPGKLSYRLNSGSYKGWSHPATLKKGEVDTFDYNDNIHIAIVEITADTDKTRFRVRFAPGLMGG